MTDDKEKILDAIHHHGTLKGALEALGLSDSQVRKLREADGDFDGHVRALLRPKTPEDDLPAPPSEPQGFAPGTVPAPTRPHVQLSEAALDAIDTFVLRVRSDMIYTKNIRARLTVIENTSGGPLSKILDAIAAEGRR